MGGVKLHTMSEDTIASAMHVLIMSGGADVTLLQRVLPRPGKPTTLLQTTFQYFAECLDRFAAHAPHPHSVTLETALFSCLVRRGTQQGTEQEERGCVIKISWAIGIK